MTWPTPLASDAAARRHVLFAWAICLETAVCFAGLVLLLLLGTIILPIVLARAELAGEFNRQIASLATAVVVGWCGLGAIVRVVFLVCTGRRQAQRAGWTLLGLTCGVGLTIFICYSGWTDDLRRDAMMAFAYLPLACTVHLVYLARRPLFTRPDTLS